MIIVEKEPYELIEEFGIYESCIFCGNTTDTWNIETNNPVCSKCAETKNFEDISMEKEENV